MDLFYILPCACKICSGTFGIQVRKAERLYWKSMVELLLASKAQEGFLEMQAGEEFHKINTNFRAFVTLAEVECKRSIKTLTKVLLP